MRINELYIIRHLRNIYGGTISYKGNCLYVEVNGDRFYVNLTNKKQFGYYIFFLQNNDCCLNENWSCIQLKDRCLAHGLFLMWCRKFNKDNNIQSTHEDWQRFMNDAYKYAVKVKGSEKEYGSIQSLCKAGI